MGIPCVHVPMQRLDSGDPICEVWHGSGQLIQGQHGSIHYRHDDRVLFGAISLAETAMDGGTGKTPLQQAAESAYRQVFALLDSLQFPYLYRFWNYIADINNHSFGLERYRQFNLGRQDAFLAARGHSVTLLEKEHHPRFHIGESLLPANLPIFEKLGVAEAMKAIGIEKWGAEFVSPWHDYTQSFEFAEALDKNMPFAYQVRRSEFDEILIRNAAAKNARVVEGCEVKTVDFLPDHAGVRVHAHHEDGTTETVHARFVADASGRDTFLGNRLKAKQRNKKHASAAIYAHFSGAERKSGKLAGNITVFWFDHGWMWYIPLADGITSVGAVMRPDYMKTRKQKSLEQFLQETISLCEPLSQRLKNARLSSPVVATGNYSYICDHSHGSNYLLLGDAYAFIDPMFSSGVLLAMQSAMVGADTIDTCLRHPQQAPAALENFERTLRIGLKEFSWFIYRMNTPSFRDMFMLPSNTFRVKEALLSLLAGDLYRNTPIRGPLLFFKGVYYTKSLLSPRRAFQSWRMRKANIKSAALPATPS